MARVTTDCTKGGRTVPYYADQCDINKIFRKAIASGIPIPAPGPMSYFDCTAVSDFRSAMEQVQFAQNAFDILPSEVRDRFRNSPAVMLDFLNNPANRPEAERLGLINPVNKVDQSTQQGGAQ